MTRRFAFRWLVLILVGICGGAAITIAAGIVLGGRDATTAEIRRSGIVSALVRTRWLRVPGLRVTEERMASLYKLVLREHVRRHPEETFTDRPPVLLCPGPESFDVPSLDPDYDRIDQSELKRRARAAGNGQVPYLRVCVVDASLSTVRVAVSYAVEVSSSHLFVVDSRRSRFECGRTFGGWECVELATD